MDKNKLILIIGTVLIVIAVALSAVSVIMTSSVLKKVNAVTAGTEAVVEGDKVEVPISETENFELADPMIGTLPSTENPKTIANVSIEVGFRIEKDKKKTAPLIELMTANEGVIRDRISDLLETKTLEDYEKEGFKEQFQQEILELISKELDTELIVDVYFRNNLKSVR